MPRRPTPSATTRPLPSLDAVLAVLAATALSGCAVADCPSDSAPVWEQRVADLFRCVQHPKTPQPLMATPASLTSATAVTPTVASPPPMVPPAGGMPPVSFVPVAPHSVGHRHRRGG